MAKLKPNQAKIETVVSKAWKKGFMATCRKEKKSAAQKLRELIKA
jgi:hypothetical protein